jgi:hypothetical protein
MAGKENLMLRPYNAGMIISISAFEIFRRFAKIVEMSADKNQKTATK